MNLLLALVFFTIAVLICFTLPGYFLLTLSKIILKLSEKIFYGTVVGFVFFTLVSYIFIVIGLTDFVVPLVVIFDIFIFKKSKKFLFDFREVKNSVNRNKTLIAIFILGIFGQMLIIAPSGRFVNGDLVFWSSHGFDGTWHLALIEEIKRGWPFQNPIFAGEKLVNYHYFADIPPVIFSKFPLLTSFDLHFRHFPLLYSLLLGTSVYLLTKKISNNTGASLWATFFTYFAGSFGYLATYLKNRTISGESLFWGSQIQSSSGNPPQIISNILVLTYLYLFYLLLEKRNKILFFVAACILGISAMFKVYAAISLMGATTVVGIWLVIKQKNLYFLSLLFVALIAGVLIYLPNVSSLTSFLIFQPWWFIRTMIVEPSRLDWVDLEYKRQTYIHESNWKRVIYIESIGFFIFFFGNLGMRFIGLWDFFKTARNLLKKPFSLLFICLILISLILPLLFLQKGVAGNTSQFLQYFLLLFGILAGLSVGRVINNLNSKLFKILAGASFVALAIPTQLGLIYDFYSHAPFAKISKSELAALEFVKNNLNGNVLSAPFDPTIDLKESVPNIWDWSDTAYVSALGGKRSYFEAREQVDIMGYNYQERDRIRRSIFVSDDPQLVKSLIIKTEIQIIYFPKRLSPQVKLENIGLTKKFENDEAVVFVVN